MPHPKRAIRQCLRKLVPWAGVRQSLKRIYREWIAIVRQLASTAFPRNNLRRLKSRGLKLNLGCGELIREGWINMDWANERGQYYVDCRDPLPLAEGQAEHIHTEHFLDQLEYPAAKALLRECFRVLQPGGSMRIILADAQKYIERYAAGDREFFDRMRELGEPTEPCRTPMEVINQMFRLGGNHKFSWDFETLELALRDAGFERVERSALNHVDPRFKIDGTDWWRPHESLYVNASKPA